MTVRVQPEKMLGSDLARRDARAEVLEREKERRGFCLLVRKGRLHEMYRADHAVAGCGLREQTRVARASGGANALFAPMAVGVFTVAFHEDDR